MALTRVRYVGPFAAGVEVEYPVDRWVEVAQGGELEVPASVAERLLEQPDNWALADEAEAPEPVPVADPSPDLDPAEG